YADSLPEATSGWAPGNIETYPVTFSEKSLAVLREATDEPRLMALIEQMLAYDPRPTSQRKARPLGDPASEGKPFAFRILDYDIHWQIRGGGIHVTEVIRL